MSDRNTIIDLLNKLASENEQLSWQITCLYSDGKGITFNQIKLKELGKQTIIGTISYQVETNQVHYCKYKNFDKTQSESVIDLLLDIINDTKKGD